MKRLLFGFAIWMAAVSASAQINNAVTRPGQGDNIMTLVVEGDLLGTALPVTIASGSVGISGAVTVIGSVADGSAAADPGVLISGKDGAGNIQDILVDTAGAIAIQDNGGSITVDQGASGVDADSWNMMIRNLAGTELGTAANPFGVTLFDAAAALFGTASNPFVVQGTAAEGVAVSGNPVLIGGQDGLGKVQNVLVGSASGRLILVSPHAVNFDNLITDVTAFPHDATNDSADIKPLGVLNYVHDPNVGPAFRTMKGDNEGIFSQGSTADGAAVTAKPLLMGGQDGTNVQSIKTDAAGELQVDVLSDPPLSHTTDSVRLGDGTNLTGVSAAGELEVSGDGGVDLAIASNQTTGNASLVDIELNTDTGTTMDHKAVVVGTTATQILAADPTRRSAVILNAFTDVVAIGNSDVTLNTAVATDGFVLSLSGASSNGTGGSLTLNTTAAIFGIGTSASSKVIVIFETD